MFLWVVPTLALRFPFPLLQLAFRPPFRLACIVSIPPRRVSASGSLSVSSYLRTCPFSSSFLRALLLFLLALVLSLSLLPQCDASFPPHRGPFFYRRRCRRALSLPPRSLSVRATTGRSFSPPVVVSLSVIASVARSFSTRRRGLSLSSPPPFARSLLPSWSLSLASSP